MIKIVNYTPGDVKRMNLKWVYGEDDYDKILESLNDRSHFRTLELDGKPIAIVGFTVHKKGVCEIWGMLTEDIKKAPHSFHRTCMGLLGFTQKEMGFHRMQVIVRSDFDEGRRWIESLGFMPESLMRKYEHDGEDSIMYVRF